MRFRSDPSKNGNGVRGRGHKDLCFYCMIIDRLWKAGSSLKNYQKYLAEYLNSFTEKWKVPLKLRQSVHNGIRLEFFVFGNRLFI